MKRRFVFQEEKSHKFWTVHTEGLTLTTVYGRVGSAGSATSKEFASEKECIEAAEDLIKQKVRKGYKEDNLNGEQSAALDTGEFWNLIDRARKNAEGEVEEQASILIEQLSKRPTDDILALGRIFEELHDRSYTSSLWAAAFIILGGCSDDGFDYFRGWLISRGREIFENALNDPQTLAKIIDPEEAYGIDGEVMLGIASSAYEEKTGKTDYYDVLGKSPGRPDIQLDWSEEREDLAKKFPILVEKYWAE